MKVFYSESENEIFMVDSEVYMWIYRVEHENGYIKIWEDDLNNLVSSKDIIYIGEL